MEKDSLKKYKVGILTTLYEANTAYSLWSVIESQMVSLVKNGYEAVFFVHDNFKDDDKVPQGVEIRKVVPRFLLTDYSDFREIDPKLEQEAQKSYEALKEHTKDLDIIIEHDFLLQGWFMPYCMAIHRLAEETNIKWLHWIHSVPRPMPANCKYPHNLRFKLPKNSKLVYLNNQNVIEAAEAYQTFPKNVRVVYNPVDPRLYWNVHPLVKKLIDQYGLLDKDLIQVYPLSTTRMVSGKQIKIAIDIFSKLKELGQKVSLVVANAHANDKREKQVIGEVLSYASQKGLSVGEIIFTSLEGSEYELGVPREVIAQLFMLSNLFIFPSVSENGPLILYEAMLSKCLLVLNSSVPCMREFGQENALYFKFGSIWENVEYDDKEKFMMDVAKIIMSEFSINKALKGQNFIKQKLNYDKVFESQILPLLHEYGDL